MNNNKTKKYLEVIALAAIGFTGCTNDPFNRDCDENPVAIPDIQLPNGEIDSSYVVEIIDLVKDYGISAIDFAEVVDKDSAEKYGIYVENHQLSAGEYYIMVAPKIAGKNTSVRISIREYARMGCQPRVSAFKAVIPEIK